MRAVGLALAASLVGALGATFASAGEPAAVGPAVCIAIPLGGAEKFIGSAQGAINEHLAGGRTHFLNVPQNTASAICAW